MTYTVKKVADISGVTVRTLHHYDRIGLLRPPSVSPSGYRLYTKQDLEKLQQILFFKHLGFALAEIKSIIDSPGFERRRALFEHRDMLLKRQADIGKMIRLVDRTLDCMERGEDMKEKEMFDGFDHSKYEEEARQRWGGTPEFEESVRRARRYSKEDWARIREEGETILHGLAPLMGREPSDPEVQEWIRKHHRMINDRFYTCSLEVYRGLGDLYVEDERFTVHFEKVKPGLAGFMRAAMHAYCDRESAKDRESVKE